MNTEAPLFSVLMKHQPGQNKMQETGREWGSVLKRCLSLFRVSDSLEGLVKETRCCNSSERHKSQSTTALSLYAGKEQKLEQRIFFAAGSTVVYVYTGREHKINSEYKKSSFTCTSSPRVHFPLYMTEISKARLISLLTFHPPKQIDTVQGFFFSPFFLRSCLLEF